MDTRQVNNYQTYRVEILRVIMFDGMCSPYTAFDRSLPKI